MPQVFSGYMVETSTRLLDRDQQPTTDWTPTGQFRKPQGSYANPYIFTTARRALSSAGRGQPRHPIRDQTTYPVRLPEQTWDEWRAIYDLWLIESITGYREYRYEARRVTVNME